jgi:hypothetical protein
MDNTPPLPRWAAHVGFVLIGLGAGVLLYRYAVLGIWFSGTKAGVLTGASLGALVVGGQFVRRQPARPPAPLAIGLLLLGLGAGAGVGYGIAPPAQLALETRQLPGLSIGLPHGEEKESMVDYDKGKLIIGNAGGVKLVTGMAWDSGELPEVDDAKTIANVVAAMVDAKVGKDAPAMTVGKGLPSHTFVLESKHGPGWMTLFSCGRRYFVLFNLGSAAARVHTRALASVDCHPDAAKEATPVAGLPVAIDLPPEWKVTQKEGNQLTYQHDAEDRIMTFVGMPAGVDVPKAIEALMSQMGDTKAKLTSLPDDAGHKLWALELENEPSMKGVATQFSCGAQTIMGIVLATPDQLADGKQKLLSARCK